MTIDLDELDRLHAAYDRSNVSSLNAIKVLNAYPQLSARLRAAEAVVEGARKVNKELRSIGGHGLILDDEETACELKAFLDAYDATGGGK